MYEISDHHHSHHFFIRLQLNQQKGATSQDLSFLNEASPIYVTSLSGNSVTTSSSSTTAAKGPGPNELIVADSSDYARAQQDHVRVSCVSH